jgi:hypothetical protein
LEVEVVPSSPRPPSPTPSLDSSLAESEQAWLPAVLHIAIPEEDAVEAEIKDEAPDSDHDSVKDEEEDSKNEAFEDASAKDEENSEANSVDFGSVKSE